MIPDDADIARFWIGNVAKMWAELADIFEGVDHD